MDDGDCLRRPAPVLRPPGRGTPLSSAPRPGSHTDSTPVRWPYVWSTPALPRDFRQNIRPSGYAGVVALRSTATAVSTSCAPSKMSRSSRSIETSRRNRFSSS